MSALDEKDAAVLRALVEGYAARSDTKERFRALSEYELARRLGAVDCTYAEYEQSPIREQVRAALGRLQTMGLARAAAVAGRYETFVPVESEAVTPATAPPAEPPMPTSFEGQLGEIVRLLRSIDRRLAELADRLPDQL